jgi:hypothetical protein
MTSDRRLSGPEPSTATCVGNTLKSFPDRRGLAAGAPHTGNRICDPKRRAPGPPPFLTGTYVIRPGKSG